MSTEPLYDAQFQQAIETLKQRLPCCPNCFNFNVKTEVCELAPGERPPARIIAFGCPAFDYCPF